jgi:hypothetical protein
MRSAQILIGLPTSFVIGSWGLITATALTSSNKQLGGVFLYMAIGLFILSVVLIFTDAVQSIQKILLIMLIVPFAMLLIYVGFGGDETQFWSFFLNGIK